MSDLSIEVIQLLQIAEPNKAFHRLHFLSQMKQFSTYAGKIFDVKRVQSVLDSLVEKNYLEFLENIESYRITKAGIDVLEE